MCCILQIFYLTKPVILPFNAKRSRNDLVKKKAGAFRRHKWRTLERLKNGSSKRKAKLHIEKRCYNDTMPTLKITKRCVGIYSDNYALHKYGLPLRQMARAASRIRAEIKAARKRGEITKFTGNLNDFR
jgi:hypothetical protein